MHDGRHKASNWTSVASPPETNAGRLAPAKPAVALRMAPLRRRKPAPPGGFHGPGALMRELMGADGGPPSQRKSVAARAIGLRPSLPIPVSTRAFDSIFFNSITNLSPLSRSPISSSYSWPVPSDLRLQSRRFGSGIFFAWPPLLLAVVLSRHTGLGWFSIPLSTRPRLPAKGASSRSKLARNTPSICDCPFADQTRDLPITLSSVDRGTGIDEVNAWTESTG